MPLLNLKNRVFLDKEPYADVYKAHLPQNTIGQAYSVSTDKTELRDLLNSELSGLKSSGTDPSGFWSNEIWDHKATFKKAVLYVHKENEYYYQNSEYIYPGFYCLVYSEFTCVRPPRSRDDCSLTQPAGRR
ncbi:hypothetical protein ES705_23980 [subsurface metagenome]